jgi:hypothetical protein
LTAIRSEDQRDCDDEVFVTQQSRAHEPGQAFRSLSAIETALTLTNSAFPLAIVCLLRIDPAPEVHALREALAWLLCRYPLLGAHIVRRGRSFRFEAAAEPLLPLRVVEWQDSAQARTIAEDELNRAADPAIEPLLHTTLIRSEAAEAGAELILRVNHAAVDGHSLGALITRLLGAVGGERADDRTIPPDPADRFRLRATSVGRGGTGLARLAAFTAREMIGDLWHRARTRGRDSVPGTESRCRIGAVVLDTEQTDALLRAARRRRTTINGVVAAALLLAELGQTQRDGAPKHAIVWVSLRPYLNAGMDNEALGAFVSMLRVAVRVTPEVDVWDLARQIDLQIAAGSRRGDPVFAAVLSPLVMGHLLRTRRQRMGSAALSYVGPLPLPSSCGPFAVSDVHGFVTSNPLAPPCSAFAHLTFGRLTVDLMVQESDFPEESRERLAATLARTLEGAGQEDAGREDAAHR